MGKAKSANSFGSRGSMSCMLTPESVVGANIEIGNSDSLNLSDKSDRWGQFNDTNESAASASPSLTAAEVALDMDLASTGEPSKSALTPSPQLVNCFRLESSADYQVTPDYLHSSALPFNSENSETLVGERCRRKTCEWMYDICDFFLLNREVVGVSLYYVDRYFTIKFDGRVPISRKEFQLVALTSLYLAIKTHGEARNDLADTTAQPWNRLVFSLETCASISRKSFGVPEIKACELSILTSLNWHINPVVPSGIVVDYLVSYLPQVLQGSIADNRSSSLAESDAECIKFHVYDCAKYLAELSVSVPALCLVYRPSIVSYASILVAFDTLRTPPASISSRQRLEFEEVAGQVSAGYYDRRKEDIEGASKILRTICPTLIELFPTPTLSSRCASNSNEALLLSPTTAATSL